MKDWSTDKRRKTLIDADGMRSPHLHRNREPHVAAPFQGGISETCHKPVFIRVHLWFHFDVAGRCDIDGFILAGGESSRMGQDKALLEIGGLTLLERAAQLLAGVAGQVSVIGPPRAMAGMAAPFVPDDFPGAGPLGGIATALRVARQPWCLVLACDLPYLTQAWLEFLAGRAIRARCDALLPHSEKGFEPLCAMYRVSCVPAIRAALGRGVRKVTDGLEGLAVETIPAQDWRPFDPQGNLFKNMNTPEDCEEARAYFQRTLR
jgi:molybdopterin-guanine dinucleotide biosynthesis protein A